MRGIMAKYYFTDRIHTESTGDRQMDPLTIGIRAFDEARCEAIRQLTHMRPVDLPPGKEIVLRIRCEDIEDDKEMPSAEESPA